MIRMTSAWWPLAELRLETPRLVLRVPTETDLYALADLAALGVHDPLVQPFAYPWTDASAAERARSVLQHQWRQWGQWTADKWALELAVLCDGVVAGLQGVSAESFAVLREVSTGSWLGREHQGRGIGTEMRAAVLHLAFAGLGADYALSTAFADNPASLTVSSKLGYADDGLQRQVRRGEAAVARRFRMDRATWLATETVPVSVHGLESCQAMFGRPAPAPGGEGR
jgi:RimJ/RimL family protein N-acetyltransferase